MLKNVESQVVTYSVEGRVARIAVNNPPVNALSHAVREGLVDMVIRAQNDSSVQALVLICEGRTFFAGADIREFNQPPKAPRLIDVIQAIEDSAKPVIAAIHGSALGGGLEVALGCHARISVQQARFGLPEVKLGLIPGAGGTQRLPRLVGLEPALEMVVNGDFIAAQKALDIGLVDRVVHDELEQAAFELATEIVEKGEPLRRTSQLSPPAMVSKLLDDTEKRVSTRRRGFEAPLRCIEAVRAALELPFDEGLILERRLFDRLKASTQSQALRHVFFAEREATKLPSDADPREIKSAAVVGAGTMGTGIAMCFANAGIPVLILEKNPEQLDGGIARIQSNYDGSVRRKRLTAQDSAERMKLISGTTRFEDLHDVDIVIEAVFEDMGVKQEVFRELDRVCKAQAILATNTSYLNIDQIASVTSRPHDVIGMHFFSPANVMRLLENVRGSHTSDEVCATAMGLGRRLGKTCVLVELCDGFVGNRMLSKRTRESYFLLQEGASPYHVDRVLYEFGFPMGPFAMADLAGLDVGWRNRQGRLQSLTERERDCDILDRMVEANRLGQKTQKGFYDYGENREAKEALETQEIIKSSSEQTQTEQREIKDQEILERCLYAMINEAAHILDEGIVNRASDIDVVWINGYGFPPYRGGPLFYADQIGLDTVLEALRKYEAQHGAEYWKPAPLLVKLAESGRGFYSQ